MQFDEATLKAMTKGKTAEELFGENGLLKGLIKQITEAALKGEMDTHLGYEKHAPEGHHTGNSRNGYGKKTIKGDFGETELEVPRDRNGSFEPQLIPKGQTRFDGFDKKIIALYARGMSTRDIQDHLQELYGVEVSPTLISNVTESVLEEARAWQARPLDSVYPIVYFDAIVMKCQENKRVINKAVYLALGVNADGQKEVLGLWISQNEGAKFWLQVLTELHNRGLKDIFIACVDGLVGFPDAIANVYPKTTVQLCIVHMIRNSLRFVGWSMRKEVAKDLKSIYGAATVDEAEQNLAIFSEKWDAKYPTISVSWRRHWEHLVPFLNYPSEIRRVIYTTNAIESLNMTIRKVTRNKRVLPSDDAIVKCLYLALQNISKKWTMPLRDWGSALGRFAIEFEGRLDL
jgi:putative transposase